MTDAVRLTLAAGTCSVRDPMFPTVSRCLPVPPPTTIHGLLGAIIGGPQETGSIRFAYRVSTAGTGVDLETFQRIGDKARYPDCGRGDPIPIERRFLIDPTLVVWILNDPDRWAQAARRPVWPLRIGRSQDLVHTYHVEEVALTEASEPLDVSGTVAPAHTGLPGAPVVLPAARSADRSRSRFGDFVHAPPGHRAPSPLADPGLGGVWPLDTRLEP